MALPSPCKLLRRFLDGETTTREGRAFATHLKDCTTCSSKFLELHRPPRAGLQPALTERTDERNLP